MKKLQKSWLEARQRAEVRIRAENGDNLNMVQLNQHDTHFFSSMHTESRQRHIYQQRKRKTKRPQSLLQINCTNCREDMKTSMLTTQSKATVILAFRATVQKTSYSLAVRKWSLISGIAGPSLFNLANYSEFPHKRENWKKSLLKARENHNDDQLFVYRNIQWRINRQIRKITMVKEKDKEKQIQ